MCPFCLASIGLIVASATSAGGLTALAVKLSPKKNPVHEVTPNSSESSTIGQDRRVGPAGIASEQPTQVNKAPGTHVFLIARAAQGLARWDGAERRKEGVRGKFGMSSHREVFAGGTTS
jgi:hypothetical protein